MKLRDYQKDDIRAILKADSRALILSEAGTGKSAVAATVVRLTKRGTPAVVVCPASVTANWRRELAMWAPQLRVAVLTGRPGTNVVPRAQVYVTSWALLRAWARRLRGRVRTWILDEAHNARNPASKRSRVAQLLVEGAPHLLVLTGTPVVAGSTDMDVLLGLFGARPPLILRRTVADVAQLPPLTVRRVACPMAPRYQARYDKIATDLRTFLQEIGRAPKEVQRAMKAEAYVRFGHLRRCLERGKAVRAASWAASRVRKTKLPIVLFFDTLAAVKLAKRQLSAEGVASAVLQGSVDQEARRVLVRDFQARRIPVLLCTRAGIEGVTLTAASECGLVCGYLTAAEEDQAVARIHRLGQTRETRATIFVAPGTLDDRMHDIVTGKREVATATLAAILRPLAPPEARPPPLEP